MNEQYKKAILGRLIPQPESLELKDTFCILKDGLQVTFYTAQPLSSEDRKRIQTFLKKFPYFQPQISAETCSSVKDFSPEQYAVSVEPESLTIRAYGMQGIDYALKTLRQMSEPVRDTMTVTHEMLPCCEIRDQPVLNFRAIHFCIFPETSMTTVIKNLRLAAYHKFNCAVIESWGVFPFRSHPEFGWKEKKKSPEEFIALREAAKECGIRIIPQFNIFGHASLSRVCTAKHAILDENPELAPLFEPSGWSFCLSSPVTRQVITDLVLELYDFYEKPEYFHLGCDEAYDFQTCFNCASQNACELIGNHIRYFRDLFAGKNTRVIMWHDMMFRSGDPRWAGCITCGDERTEDLADYLPKDIIIADWQYGRPAEDRPDFDWPTSVFLQEKGFDVAVCPWLDTAGTLSLSRMVVRRKMFGMIETTWNHAFNGEYTNMFVYPAVCAWQGDQPPVFPNPEVTARHLRQVCQDMGISAYEDFGQSERQFFEGQQN